MALSTGQGTRCPRCGQVETYPLLTTDALDIRLDAVLARQILLDMALRSDGDARLLCELARRLLGRTGKRAGKVREASAPSSDPCPHCQAGEPSVWDGELFHYAHPAGNKLKVCRSPWKERCLRCSADVAPDADELCEQHKDISQ